MTLAEGTLVLMLTFANGPTITAPLPASICLRALEGIEAGEKIVFDEEGRLLDIEEAECVPEHECDPAAERATMTGDICT